MFEISITKEDVPFVKLACLYNDIPFGFILSEEEGSLSAKIDAEESRRAEILKDIRCEKQSADWGGLPVYSYETLTNEEKLRKFQRLNGTEGFLPLKEDEERINKDVLGV